jgi:hypothetical protein
VFFVCCDQACTGSCQGCDVMGGTKGTCSNQPTGTQGGCGIGNACTDTQTCSKSCCKDSDCTGTQKCKGASCNNMGFGPHGACE